MYRAVCLVTAALMTFHVNSGQINGDRSLPPSTSHDLVKQLSPGLTVHRYRSQGQTIIAYQAASPAATASLIGLLRARHVDVSRLFPRASSGFLSRAGFTTSTQCTANYEGSGGPGLMRGYMEISCADNSNISGGIAYTPVLNTYSDGSQSYSGTGYLSALYTHTCRMSTHNGVTTYCGKVPGPEPDDWAIQESWSSDNGESGYACFAGQEYPYLEAYGCTEVD
jgi:hypothetical protein